MESVEIVGVAGSMMVAGLLAWRGEYSSAVGVVTMVLGYVFARNSVAIMKFRQASLEAPRRLGLRKR
jgi:hypothetical protein